MRNQSRTHRQISTNRCQTSRLRDETRNRKRAQGEKAEYLVLDNKLSQRESNIDRRDAQLIAKENVLEEKTETLNRRLKEAERKEEVLQQKIDSIIEELEKVAQLSVNEARDEIFQRVESKLSREIAAFIKNKEDEAKETLKKKPANSSAWPSISILKKSRPKERFRASPFQATK
jgi:uncharacterized protein (DUF3084 family)